MRSSTTRLRAYAMHIQRQAWRLTHHSAAFLAPVLIVLLTAHDTHAWLVRNDFGLAAAVRATSDGDVITGGDSPATDASDFTVRRQHGSDGSEVWTYKLDGSASDLPGSFNDLAWSVFVDSAGDVIAGGVTRNSGTALDVQVVKLGGNDGQLKWSRVLDSPIHGNDDLTVIALHPTGDVVVSATMMLTTAPQQYYVTVARLAGADGAVLWQHDIIGQPGALSGSVNCDPAGDVLVTGRIDALMTQSDLLAVKLDGATGSELWRTALDGGGAADDGSYAGTVDAAGDFYLGGQTSQPLGAGSFTVYKLSAATGSLLWRADAAATTSSYSSWVSAITVDSTAGSVYAVGPVDSRDQLYKLSAATGASVWMSEFRRDYWNGITLDPAGNVILNGARRYRFGFVKISAADGRALWRRSVGPANSYNGGYANAAALDPAGNLLLAGKSVAPPLPMSQVNGPISYTVVKACGANGRITRTDECP